LDLGHGDCGRGQGKQANPLRLSCLVFVGSGLALAMLVIPILPWMGYFAGPGR